MPRAPFDDIARRVLDALPRGLADAETDVRRNLRAAIAGTLSRMDLVTREEFDAQARVLARTREMLEQLEQRVREMESEAEDGARPAP